MPSHQEGSWPTHATYHMPQPVSRIPRIGCQRQRQTPWAPDSLGSRYLYSEGYLGIRRYSDNLFVSLISKIQVAGTPAYSVCIDREVKSFPSALGREVRRFQSHTNFLILSSLVYLGERQHDPTQGEEMFVSEINMEILQNRYSISLKCMSRYISKEM